MHLLLRSHVLSTKTAYGEMTPRLRVWPECAKATLEDVYTE